VPEIPESFVDKSRVVKSGNMAFRMFSKTSKFSQLNADSKCVIIKIIFP
jgi:hypothetical protein